VQYIKFKAGPQAPVAVGSDLDVLSVESELTSEQRGALQADLDS
jgi:hypothetical protein